MNDEALMTAFLSQDLRQRLLHAVEEGSSARAAADRFGVSTAAAIKLIRRVRETGSIASVRIGGYRQPLLARHEGLLRDLTASRKGITLAEIRAELVQRGIELGCPATIWSTLRRLGLSREKLPEGAAEQDRPDVATHRRDWQAWQRFMGGAAFVFIDGREQTPLARVPRPTEPPPTGLAAAAGGRKASA